MWGITHRHCNIKETCDCILDIKNTSSNQACSTHHYIYIYISNACLCGCMTYLIASQHLCINEWTYECMFMVLKQEKKRKP